MDVKATAGGMVWAAVVRSLSRNWLFASKTNTLGQTTQQSYLAYMGQTSSKNTNTPQK